MEFSRQEYWSRLPFLTPEDLPNLGIKPLLLLLHWQADSFVTVLLRKPHPKEYLDPKYSRWASQVALVLKNSPADSGDTDLFDP